MLETDSLINSTIRFAYDALNRLTSIVNPQGITDYGLFRDIWQYSRRNHRLYQETYIPKVQMMLILAT